MMATTSAVITVSGLGKQYRIGRAQQRHDRLTESIMHALKAPVRRLRRLGQPAPSDELIWALRDVSFSVQPGEVVGIIGRNGAGKSTLLKILSRITEPTEGRVELRGRVGSLLEVGTGFHPELTGRENVYLNGAILGMTRSEIDQKFDEIVAFAEIEKFIDTPVKRYSSGMYVRLAFAVAAHLEPEILMVDEVLAVGDAAFQKKCLGKMGDVAHEGRTVLFVSHNMASMLNLCQSGLLLEHGKIRFAGSIASTVETYIQRVESEQHGKTEVDAIIAPEYTGPVRVTSISLQAARASSDNGKHNIRTREDVILRIHYSCDDVMLDYGFVAISTLLGERVLSLGTHHDADFAGVMRGEGVLECTIPELPLVPGDYSVTVALGINNPRQNVHVVHDALHFRVQLSDYFGTGNGLLPGQGHYVQPSKWRIVNLQN